MTAAERESRRREAIADTARTLREQTAKGGRTISQDDAERRVRKAVIREEQRNP